jgi:alanine dehydrogenase
VGQGIIKPEDIHAEIGEVLLGTKAGRENAQEITLFDTVGMAIQDTVTVAMLYKAALKKGLGSYYEFFKS